MKCGLKNIFGPIVPGKLRRNWGGFSTHANRSAIWLTTSDNMNEQVGSWFFFISGAILCNQTLQIGAISSIWLWASNDLHLQTRLKIRVFQNYVDDSNFLTTTTETSQNSSKWSHFSTDHKKYIDLSIRPPYFKILRLETPCQTWLFHKTFGHLVCYCFSAAVELS